MIGTEDMLIWYGMELCAMGGAQRPRDALHHCDAFDPEQRLGNPVEHDHVGWIAHVMVRLDRHDVGIEPGCAEVLFFGCGVANVGRHVVGNVVPVVIARLVADHGE